LDLHEEQQEVVLVTGGSGLIGQTAIQRLSEQFRCTALDIQCPSQPLPQAEFICLDLGSDESVKAALDRVKESSGQKIASVVHLAAYYDFSGEPSDKYEQITVQGTARLLWHLRNFDVDQFVFSSTMLVHAPCQPGERIDEEWPLRPAWPYPESKIRTEELIRSEREDIPVVMLRIAGVYDDECHSLPLAHQIQRIYERHLTASVFPGDTSRGQSFVHLEDAVEAIWRAVQRRNELPPEVILLIGEEETLSYDYLQRSLGKLIHGLDWQTRQIPQTLAKAGAWVQDQAPGVEGFIKPWMIDYADDHYALNIGRARQLLGWAPRHSLRDTLPKMVEALQRDPERFYRQNKLEGPSEKVVQRAAAGEPRGRIRRRISRVGRQLRPSQLTQRVSNLDLQNTGRQALFSGLAGLLATVPMTGVMKLLHRRLPWWQRYPLPPRIVTLHAGFKAGLRRSLRTLGDRSSQKTQASIAHYSFGTAAGMLYGPLAGHPRLSGDPAGATPVRHLLSGIAYGLAVWAGGYLGVLPAMRIHGRATGQPPQRIGVMIAAHVVWGAALGLLTDGLRRLACRTEQALTRHKSASAAEAGQPGAHAPVAR
jgi:nucleoside-diphosphate-sugar epimerase